ncbi:MAG: ISPsy11, transposase OrfA [Massilia sp.]|jgi:transposase|nr:ISPsy11, transposase OrfA [Massilia sp.]
MSEGTKRSQRDYGMTFKLGVVSAVEKGELTYKQAQQKYGIQGRSTVLVWLRKHGQQDWSLLAGTMSQRRRNQTVRDMSTPLTPEQRIKQLEAELDRSKKQSLVYKTMLDVIAKEHGVNLVKKPSPGQLKSSKKSKA